jgi:hypothetical protein
MKREETLLKTLFIITIGFLVAMSAAWAINLYKLTQCDFTSDYQCEVIHGLGIVPPVALITVWFLDDSQN